MSIFRIYIVILLAIGLVGCVPMSEQPINPTQSVSKIVVWDIQAVIAIRSHAGAEGGSVNLQWQQRQQNYTMRLFGPLGAGLIEVTGQPGRAMLETADGKKFSAFSPELLLAQQTGWHLPVSNLYYWIRGLPVPGLPAKKQFDAYHHLSRLSQDGWTVDFLRYSRVGQVDVPVKLLFENWRIQVKMVIHQWRFS